MDTYADEVSESTVSLELRVQLHAEAAKRAIAEYKKTILHEAAADGARRLESQREVELAIEQYMRLRRKLDELRAVRCCEIATGISS